VLTAVFYATECNVVFFWLLCHVHIHRKICALETALLMVSAFSGLLLKLKFCGQLEL
jgi:hypothetical protein